MTKNEIKVMSIFKIIIRIWKKIFLWENIQVFTWRMSVIFYIFHLNKKELIQQVCLKKFIKNETFNSTSHKTKKQKERSKNII